MTRFETSGLEPPPTPSSGTRTFVDREHEIADLLDAVDEAAGGRGRLFLVSGEAGIGKTALALAFADQAARRGARVFWGRCREGGGAPAYWPWIQVIRALMRGRSGQDVAYDSGVRYLRQLVPEIFGKLPIPPTTPGPESLESDHDRFYLFDAVGGLLRTAAEREPVVLVLDDLHWADRSSLLLLRFLAGEIQDSSILVVAMYREAEARRVPQTAEMLADLGRLGSRLALQGFEPREIASLIVQTAGVTAPANLVREIHRMTRGNPFFIDELVRLLGAEGRLGDPRALQAAELKIPEGVRQLIRRRVAPLSAPAREVLSIAAVIGREFPLALLSAVAGLSHDALPETLAEAVAADVVEESPDAIGVYRFTHALIRETLYGELPHSRRLALHWRVGGMLEQLHAGNLEPYVTDLAFHFLRATPIGSVAKAAGFAIRAGKKAAERLAHEEAAAYFAQALEGLDMQVDADPGTRCDVLLDLGDAQRKAGDASAAAASFERAADIAIKIDSAERFGEAALRWGGASGPLGETQNVAGRLNRGQIAVLEKALARLPETDGALRARLLGRLAAELYWDSTAETRRAALGAEALAMARRLGDPVQIAAALTAKRVAIWGPDDLDVRLVEINEAIRLAEQVGDRERGLQCRLWRIGDLVEFGDAYGAEIEIDVYTRIAESLRQPLFLSYAAMLRAFRALLHGRFDEAGAQSGEALRLGLSAHHGLASVSCGAQMFRIAWERGDRDVLEAALAGIRAEVEMPVTRCGLALVLSRIGKVEAAGAELAELSRDGFAALRKDMTWLPGIAVLSQVAVTVGDRERADVLYRLLSPYAGRVVIVGPPVADCHGTVDGFLAELAATLGRAEAATAHFEAALRQILGMGALPLAADLWLQYAKFSAASGKQEAAVELLRQSLEVADSLGMRRVADEARALQASVQAGPRQSAAAAGEIALLQRRGDYWTVSFGGRTGEIKDSLGLHYLAHLLRHPSTEFHVMDLAALCAREVAGAEHEAKLERELADRTTLELGHAGEVLDTRARAEYVARLEELRAELADATRSADRAEELEREIAFFERELSSAYGLGGRARRGADVAERVRKAVTNRIRDALAKIQTQNPPLCVLLVKSLKMGSFCSYSPDSSVSWVL